VDVPDLRAWRTRLASSVAALVLGIITSVIALAKLPHSHSTFSVEGGGLFLVLAGGVGFSLAYYAMLDCLRRAGRQPPLQWFASVVFGLLAAHVILFELPPRACWNGWHWSQAAAVGVAGLGTGLAIACTTVIAVLMRRSRALPRARVVARAPSRGRGELHLRDARLGLERRDQLGLAVGARQANRQRQLS
jgi:hypothetical protein